ncbi:UNVERIFIED_CONTAM: 2-oxoglutarate dehydrogenase complex 2, mitochondrial [Sesamum calycinum]|uniref:dihydrolipoyllysine-residue succinyltransferase n=2 Tax=Sesamum TaxID=4181 RepID=A0AAW2NTJ8_9LAMI
MANNVAGAQLSRYAGAKLTRHDFPADFVFGGATSTYQVEGGYAQDGRSLSNWDVFALQRPGKIIDGSNGCVAIDHYNRFKDDVRLMKKLGIDAYRFSLSWSRILPGIEPFVTIFHFDVPQCLEEEYGGFLSPKIVQDFAEFAELCFFEFGDRVKFWITQNEPVTFAKNGYVLGSFPPGHGSTSAHPSAKNAVGHRCCRGVDRTCYGGDAGTEPYIVGHHLIIAHAVAVDIYRKNYQAVQGGKIGITNMSGWFEPYSNTQTDIDAASRAVDFMLGWFVAPIATGDYPPVMRERVGNRLPKFTPEQVKLIKGSYDFMGLNYYTTYWAAYSPTPPGTPPTYTTDQEAEFFMERDGVPIGEQAASDWLYIVPYGIRNLILHTKNVYNDPVIYITENGVNEKNDRSLTIAKAIKDDYRIKFHQDHLAYVKEAIDSGARIKGYFAWSLFDNYEWAEGYLVRFGMFYIDYVNGYTRNNSYGIHNFIRKIFIKQEIEGVMLGVLRRKAASGASSASVYGKSLYKLKPAVPTPRPCSAAAEEIIHYRGFGGARTFCHLPLAGSMMTLMPKREVLGNLQQDVNMQIWSRSFSSSTAEGDIVEAVVPFMGESISDGTLATFLKKPGDRVEVDEPIAQVETDKVTIDVNSPEAGVIQKFIAKEGDTVEPGTKVAIISRSGEGATHVAPSDDKASQKAPPPPTPAEEKKEKPTPKVETTPVVPMTRLRKRVATRLKDSQNTFALLTTFNEVDMTNLMKLRSDYKDAFFEKHGVKLGLMSGFVKAAISALQRQPIVNAVIDGDDIIYRDYVDISIAVGTPKGLVVPVLRNAERMNFAEVEKEINTLAKKANDGTISIDEMAGGTFTISNGGVYGSLLSTPIINPPQSAILGMHSIVNRPMVVGGAIVPRPMMYIALTYDHRLIDGREAVFFLRRIKDVVEDPRRLLLDV